MLLNPSVLTAWATIAALVWTIIFDQKKYKADLIKRTQVEWLSQLRSVLVSFIDDIPTYVFLYLDTIKEPVLATKKVNDRLLTQKLNQIKNSYCMIQTFLLDDDYESENIRQDCDNLWQELIDFKRYLYDHPISPVGNIEIETKIVNKVTELEQQAIKDSKDYFIVEWAKIRKTN